MKRFRDPTPALPRDRLPLSEKILRAVSIIIIVAWVYLIVKWGS